MNEEWCYEKLENLKAEEGRSSTLLELRDCLQNTPDLLNRVAYRFLCSPEIYDCLPSIDQVSDGSNTLEPMDTATTIIILCIDRLSLREHDLSQAFQRIFSHKNSRIKVLALEALLKKTVNKIDVDYLIATISDELLHKILTIALYREIKLPSWELAILIRLLHSTLEKPFFKEEILKALKGSSSVKSRAYSWAVKLVRLSSVPFEKLEYIFDHALSELDNDDFVLVRDILHIIETIAEKKYFSHYLEKKRFLNIIGRRLEEMENVPEDRSIVQDMMIFFARIYNGHPQKVIREYPNIFRSLFQYFGSGDLAVLEGAFDSLAIMTFKEQGIVLLEENYPDAIKKVFWIYADYINRLPVQEKVMAFDSLAEIFNTPVASYGSSILRRWFMCLNRGSNNASHFMVFCTDPSPNIRLSALKFIRSICLHRWGIEAVRNSAEFLEFLLDPREEFDDYIEYEKFCIIEELAKSNAFDVQTTARLRAYVNFEPTEMEDDVEGDQ